MSQFNDPISFSPDCSGFVGECIMVFDTRQQAFVFILSAVWTMLNSHWAKCRQLVLVHYNCVSPSELWSYVTYLSMSSGEKQDKIGVYLLMWTWYYTIYSLWVILYIQCKMTHTFHGTLTWVWSLLLTWALNVNALTWLGVGLLPSTG